MWECYHCGFQNVDAAPVCVKCRARKPAPGEVPQRRSYHFAEMASRERYADKVMAQGIPAPPSFEEIREKWAEAAAKPEDLIQELALLEQRVFALREALRLLADIVKNPQARGNDDKLGGVVNTLIHWDEEAT